MSLVADVYAETYAHIRGLPSQHGQWSPEAIDAISAAARLSRTDPATPLLTTILRWDDSTEEWSYSIAVGAPAPGGHTQQVIVPTPDRLTLTTVPIVYVQPIDGVSSIITQVAKEFGDYVEQIDAFETLIRSSGRIPDQQVIEWLSMATRNAYAVVKLHRLTDVLIDDVVRLPRSEHQAATELRPAYIKPLGANRWMTPELRHWYEPALH